MTTLEKFSNHIGGLIKILDPLFGLYPKYSQTFDPQSYAQSGQIALLLHVFQGKRRYDIYQVTDTDMYPNNRHTLDEPLEIVVRLLMNDVICDVSIYPHRVELLS